MTDGKCVVPGCGKEAEFNSPGDWCGDHWTLWFDWPDDEPELDWMPKKDLNNEDE